MRSLLNKESNKKGAGNVKGIVGVLIGIVIVLTVITAVAPTMFNGSNNISGAPSWFNTVYPIMIAAGLIFLIWRGVR